MGLSERLGEDVDSPGASMTALTRHEKYEQVVACLLTVGEFGASIFLMVHHGHMLAFYLAVTYALRETKGGRHHHEVLFAAIKKVATASRAVIPATTPEKINAT